MLKQVGRMTLGGLLALGYSVVVSYKRASTSVNTGNISLSLETIDTLGETFMVLRGADRKVWTFSWQSYAIVGSWQTTPPPLPTTHTNSPLSVLLVEVLLVVHYYTFYLIVSMCCWISIVTCKNWGKFLPFLYLFYLVFTWNNKKFYFLESVTQSREKIQPVDPEIDRLIFGLKKWKYLCLLL